MVEVIKKHGFVWPNYDGGSNANILASLVKLLRPDTEMDRQLLPPLDDKHLSWVGQEIDRIVLMVLDGLGFDLLQEYVSEHPNSLFASLMRHGYLAPITSVVPSTTATAMASIWNGVPASVHLVSGYEIFMSEIGMMVNTLKSSPVQADESGMLEKMGVKFESFFKTGELQNSLINQDIKLFVLLNRFIVESPLSMVIYRHFTKKIGTVNLQDQLYMVRELLQKETPPMIIGAYWPALDSLSHHYGYSHEVWECEMNCISTSLETMLSKLDGSVRRKTLFVITADHGFRHSPPDNSVYLEDYPEIVDNLLMPPIGESRFRYLYIRNGLVDETLEMIRERLSPDFVAFKSVEAYESGLFGPQVSDKFLTRIGDIVVTPAGDKNLIFRKDDTDELIGRHGGLTRREMIVPFLAFVP